MTNVGYQIVTSIPRPDQALVERFRGISTTVIGDAMQRTAALPSRIRACNDVPLLGTAYTVRVPEGDNVMLYYALDNAEPGDVIVVAGGGFTERALCGEIMVRFAASRGIAGLVVDGAIRDAAELRDLDIPVHAVASSPNGPYKNGPGTVNEPVSLGSRVVHPGDLIVGDATGVVSIPVSEAEAVADECEAIVKKEEAMLDRIARNEGMDLAWMYAKIEDADVVTKDA